MATRRFREMAQQWQGEMSQRTMSPALAHIAWTRKKSDGYLQRDEDKWPAFATQLTAISLSQRMYVDESEMESVLKETAS
jgi:hypothetical protein